MLVVDDDTDVLNAARLYQATCGKSGCGKELQADPSLMQEYDYDASILDMNSPKM
ncbi:MAG: hypothetical protein U5N86_10630 [Planctomycetota bacterium]|nr:hypothetical protein [Planctomycetota bacterium]